MPLYSIFPKAKYNAFNTASTHISHVKFAEYSVSRNSELHTVYLFLATLHNLYLQNRFHNSHGFPCAWWTKNYVR